MWRTHIWHHQFKAQLHTQIHRVLKWHDLLFFSPSVRVCLSLPISAVISASSEHSPRLVGQWRRPKKLDTLSDTEQQRVMADCIPKAFCLLQETSLFQFALKMGKQEKKSTVNCTHFTTLLTKQVVEDITLRVKALVFFCFILKYVFIEAVHFHLIYHYHRYSLVLLVYRLATWSLYLLYAVYKKNGTMLFHSFHKKYLFCWTCLIFLH